MKDYEGEEFSLLVNLLRRGWGRFNNAFFDIYKYNFESTLKTDAIAFLKKIDTYKQILMKAMESVSHLFRMNTIFICYSFIVIYVFIYLDGNSPAITCIVSPRYEVRL